MHKQNESWQSSNDLPAGVSQDMLDNMHEFEDDFIVQEVPLSTTSNDWRKVPINKVESTGEEKFNQAIEQLQMTIDTCFYTIKGNVEILEEKMNQLATLIKNK